ATGYTRHEVDRGDESMPAEAGDSSASTIASLFNRAAAYLLGPQIAAPAEDIAKLLQTLDYAADEAAPDVRANRVALLEAAAQFLRIFQLESPDAPGLIFLGGELSASRIAPAHVGAPPASVGGMGLSFGAAFEACVGEGVEYLSQLELGDEAHVVVDAEALV